MGLAKAVMGFLGETLVIIKIEEACLGGGVLGCAFVYMLRI